MEKIHHLYNLKSALHAKLDRIESKSKRIFKEKDLSVDDQHALVNKQDDMVIKKKLRNKRTAAKRGKLTMSLNKKSIIGGKLF